MMIEINRESTIHQEKMLKDIMHCEMKDIANLHDLQRLVKQNSDTLFIASTCGSPHVFRLIFDICPEQVFFKDVYGNTILNNVLINNCQGALEIVGFLLDVAPGLAKVANNFGMLPLHQALMNRLQPALVKSLLQAFPKGINQDNSAVGSPVQVFFDEWLDELEDNVNDFQNLKLNENQHGNNFDTVVNTLIAIIEALERSRESNRSTNMQLLPVHSALKLDDILIPPVFTQLLIKTFPDESMKCDENGNFPLHLEANRKGINLELLELLIEENPEALTYQNKEGRTPLELAQEKHQSEEVIQALLQSHMH